MEATKKDFDAVALMRALRDSMSRDIGDMSYEEQKQYLRDRVRARQQRNRGSGNRTADPGHSAASPK